MEKEILFSLDIGTRSIVGIVGEKIDNVIKILAVDRQEHLTRAMLDGQIHDVPQVAKTIKEIHSRLVKKTGQKLPKASVAAAGRALVTIQASASIDTEDMLSLDADIEKNLEISAVQKAQRNLAANEKAVDPTGYYCVGYSIVNFKLDGSRLTTLVGQRGKLAEVTIIATFLPRPVIDSMQSSLTSIGLEIGTITLEPIAAINLLIPPTMRHLNLALVDIGAGTSDVAITDNGSVIGYGMVPCAGDEITEALSQRYLLDFNIAETIKRQINDNPPKILVPDVLGLTSSHTPKEILDSILPNIKNLAELISKEILSLNANKPPQAILLVGGGALTPSLPQCISEMIGIPVEKVAVRMPLPSLLLPEIPKELLTPEAITPLGILTLANSENLNFITIKLNKQSCRLFNLGQVKVADALLANGIDIAAMKGRPGLGLTIEVNGKTKFIPGTYGTPGTIELNGKDASLDDELKDGDKLKVIKGTGGNAPKCKVSDIVDCSSAGNFYVNKQKYSLNKVILVNDKTAQANTKLTDRDVITVTELKTILEALQAVDINCYDTKYEYVVNNNLITYTAPFILTLNGQTAKLSDEIKANDVITIEDGNKPTLEEIFALNSVKIEKTKVLFNGAPVEIDRTFKEFSVNGKPATLSYIPNDDDNITFKVSKKTPIISDVLLMGEFDPKQLLAEGKNVEILLNGEKTEFTAAVKNGDEISTNIFAGNYK